jgi:hypothetical protein
MFKILLKMINVLKCGFKALSEASCGAYSQRTDELTDLRKEMLETTVSSGNDKMNIVLDRRKIGGDMRRSASKIVFE